MVTFDAILGRVRAGLRSVGTLDSTITVPTSTDVQRKNIFYVMPARSPNDYSIILKTPIWKTIDDTAAEQLRGTLPKEFTASWLIIVTFTSHP